MKIAYVVYNERPESGLMRTQVISLLKAIKRADPQLDITLIAIWQPWVAWKFRSAIRAMRVELEAAGIRQRDIPWAVVPTRHFAYRAELFPVLRAWVRVIMRGVLRRRYAVVHCRGYLPSFGAAGLKAAYGHRVIFDMRSLWTQEHVTIGAWRAEDTIHRLWQRIESYTVERSDASIGVSPAMVEEIRKISPRGNAVHIPICVDLDDKVFDAAARDRLRTELGWAGHPVIAYQGSLGLMNSNLAEVAEYFALVREALPEARFLILTSNVAVDVGQTLARFGIAAHEFATRHPRRGELASWLSAADAGIHAMSPGPDSATRLGVKIVEYLACSLPIIVNPYVGAAADLVRRHGVGLVIETRDVAVLRAQLTALLAASPVPALRSRELAATQFSVEVCAARYIGLYRAPGSQLAATHG